MNKYVYLIRDKIHSDYRMCKRYKNFPQMGKFLDLVKIIDHPYIVKILEIYESKEDC